MPVRHDRLPSVWTFLMAMVASATMMHSPHATTVTHADGCDGIVSFATGSDTNPGTVTAPWKTIAHALTRVQTGTICLRSEVTLTLSITLALAPSSTLDYMLLSAGRGRPFVLPWTCSVCARNRPS